LEAAIFGWDTCDCGAATRFDFEEPLERIQEFYVIVSSKKIIIILPSANGSDFFDGSGSLEGSDEGSLFGSLTGSPLGSGSLEGSLAGSLEGSDVGSGSLAGSGATLLPMSCSNGNFLHSAVNFFGLHPNPTHDVPFTTITISISFSSFSILQCILYSGVSVFVVYRE
jgi:hypothetical protein